jgi:hypothetical protein
MKKAIATALALVMSSSLATAQSLSWKPDYKFDQKFNRLAKNFKLPVKIEAVGCDPAYVREIGYCYWSFYREHEIKQNSTGWEAFTNYGIKKESRAFLTVFLAATMSLDRKTAENMATKLVNACSKGKCLVAWDHGEWSLNADQNGVIVFQNEGDECDGC